MTAAFPEDLAPAASRKRPSYALGALLNLLLPGAGFTYIGQWPGHLAWFFLMRVFAGVAFALGLNSAALGVLAGLGVLGLLLFTYHLAYRARARVDFQPPLSAGVQAALIAGHVLLGLVYVGILSAVLIPNLLGARARATDAANQAIAHEIHVAVVAADVDGTLGETCPAVGELDLGRVKACRVVRTDPENPGVSVTFQDGETITLP